MGERDFLSREDHALLARDFTIADPESTPNLVKRLPPLTEPPQIIAKYDIKNTGRPRLRCSHCGERLHWKGYILLLPNEQRALLAERHCGRKAFGFKWDQIERTFSQQVSRQSDLVRLAELRRVFPALVMEIEALATNVQVRAFDCYLNDLRYGFGALSRVLGKAPKHSGRFDAEIRVRNRDAEYSRAKRQVPKLVEAAEDISVEPADRQKNQRALDRWMSDQDPIMKGDIVSMGVCAGAGILHDEKPSALLAGALYRAQRMDTVLRERSSADWTATALAEGFRTIRGIGEAVDDALALLKDFARFTSPQNIALLAAWATRDETIRGKYRTDGGTLVDESGKRLAVNCILDRIDVPALAAFWKALGRDITAA